MIPHDDHDTPPPEACTERVGDAGCAILVIVPPAMADGRRNPMNAPVTDKSYEGWRKFCDEHGLTYVSLIEVIGLWMRDDRAACTDNPDLIAEVKAVMRTRRPGRKRREG